MTRGRGNSGIIIGRVNRSEKINIFLRAILFTVNPAWTAL
jgi:hypothetical protein